VVGAVTKAKTEPIVLISTSKKQAEVIYRQCLEAAVICKYTSESTSKEHKDFKNVNVAWANVDILILTSLVTH